ncbi:putative zinc finger FYVE domain-containing protein 21 isoform X1 [Apostichopus japonicus]|uniref:Putative zinc finger FYVE domain-containing protein 21 isoform X1 n=1 Tax=Stichopus japonicus TaxID=307972 RepID=A0A2G8L2L0_STIJA|nr:putative zinc finger FYVE domain-containing protein 21 isoform X1 [Apostichopus japonicus]
MANAGKKLVRSKSGLRMVSVQEKDNSPFLLEEPEWIPDQQCLTCLNCNHKFDLIKRRHHCRRCGKCFCGGCCTEKLPLPRMGFVDPVRLCDDCADVTRKENEFYNKHLKLLVAGTFLILSGGDVENKTSFCQLTSSHREILFSQHKPEKNKANTTEWVHDPINVESIQEAVVQTGQNEIHGGMLPKSLMVRYKYIDEMRELKLVVPDDSSSRQAMAWLKAMEKAVRLLQLGNEPS